MEQSQRREDQTRIRLYNSYDLWMKQREAFVLGCHFRHNESANEKFALHLLELHESSCRDPRCTAPASPGNTAEAMPVSNLAPPRLMSNSAMPPLNPQCPPMPRLTPIKRR